MLNEKSGQTAVTQERCLSFSRGPKLDACAQSAGTCPAWAPFDP